MSDVVGFVELSGLLASLGKDAEKELAKEIKLTSGKVKTEYKQKVRRHNKTGDLEKSIQAEFTPNGLDAEIGSDEEHAVYLELGTAPHVIEPNTAPRLSWIDSSGKRVYAKRVNHPGTAAHPYLLTSFIKLTDGFDKRMGERAEKIMKRNAGGAE